jgi:hypothetical protein
MHVESIEASPLNIPFKPAIRRTPGLSVTLGGRDRPPPQRRVVALLERRLERVRVDVFVVLPQHRRWRQNRGRSRLAAAGQD